MRNFFLRREKTYKKPLLLLAAAFHLTLEERLQMKIHASSNKSRFVVIDDSRIIGFLNFLL